MTSIYRLVNLKYTDWQMTELSVQNMFIARKIHKHRSCLVSNRENITTIAYHGWISCYLSIESMVCDILCFPIQTRVIDGPLSRRAHYLAYARRFF